MNPGWRKNYLRYKSFFLNVSTQYKERADIKVYLEILLSLITITIFSVFALRPTLITIAQLIKEVETKKEALAEINSKIQKLSQAQIIYDQQRKNISLLNSAVPDKALPHVIARQIEALTSKNNVEILRVNLGEAQILAAQDTNNTSSTQNQISPKQEFEISLQTEVNIENYQNLLNLISDLEKLRMPIKFDSLSLSSKENEKDNTKKVSLFLSGKMPYLYKKGL